MVYSSTVLAAKLETYLPFSCVSFDNPQLQKVNTSTRKWSKFLLHCLQTGCQASLKWLQACSNEGDCQAQESSTEEIVGIGLPDKNDLKSTRACLGRCRGTSCPAPLTVTSVSPLYTWVHPPTCFSSNISACDEIPIINQVTMFLLLEKQVLIINFEAHVIQFIIMIPYIMIQIYQEQSFSLQIQISTVANEKLVYDVILVKGIRSTKSKNFCWTRLKLEELICNNYDLGVSRSTN